MACVRVNDQITIPICHMCKSKLTLDLGYGSVVKYCFSWELS